MKKQLIAFLMALMPTLALASGGAGYPLDHVDIDLKDKAGLQNGAKLFMNYCFGCHEAKFARYGRVSDDLDISPALMADNLLFADQKIGKLMTNPMDKKQAKAWFGAVPPDLTLVARAKGGPEWLYTYLRTFYKDESRPWGVNNKVFPLVGMPHVLAELQGEQIETCAQRPKLDDSHKEVIDPLTGNPITEEKCGVLEVVPGTGKLSAEEYDAEMRDLVAFLVYMGEPAAVERERLGVYVLLFLVFFFVFAYLLKREYWKDIH